MNFVSKETAIVGRNQPQQQESHANMNVVTILTDRDILLGRGAPTANYIGNVKFRKYINTLKGEYVSSSRHEHKQFMARQIYDTVTQEWNSRFLTIIKSSKEKHAMGMPAKMKVWVIVEENVALEKIKQALRDKNSSTHKDAVLLPSDVLQQHSTTTSPDSSGDVVTSNTVTAVTAATASFAPTSTATGANSVVVSHHHPRLQWAMLMRRRQQEAERRHHRQQQLLLLLALQQNRLAEAMRTEVVVPTLAACYWEPEQQQQQLRYLRMLQQQQNASNVVVLNEHNDMPASQGPR